MPTIEGRGPNQQGICGRCGRLGKTRGEPIRSTPRTLPRSKSIGLAAVDIKKISRLSRGGGSCCGHSFVTLLFGQQQSEITFILQYMMWEPANLLFKRDDGLCPTLLPTAHELRASKDVIIQRSAQTVAVQSVPGQTSSELWTVDACLITCSSVMSRDRIHRALHWRSCLQYRYGSTV